MKEFFEYSDENFNFHYSLDNKVGPQSSLFNTHTHLEYELYCFVRGKASFRIEGTEYPLHSGDIVILRSAESHCLHPLEVGDYERVTLHFNPEILKPIDPEGKLLRPFNDRKLGQKNLYTPADFTSPLCSMLIEGLCEKTENPHQQIISMLIPILNELCIAFDNKKETESLGGDVQGKRIIDYVNRHLFETLSLDAICERFYISKPQLCRVFKASTGSTVWEYIAVKRLLAAQRLIMSGTAPTKAAISCGFNDYSVFYRAYRRRFGASPKEAQ